MNEVIYDESTGCAVSTSTDGKMEGWCDDGTSWHQDDLGQMV